MSDESESSESTSPPVCDYCTLPVTVDAAENTDFCSTACEKAFEQRGSALPEFSESVFFQTGIEPIDSALPQGLPRDSFIVISGEPGTRRKTILVELAWRRLTEGEPVILIAASDPPLMLLEQFLSIRWNIIPYLEAGQLKVIDCYSHQRNEQGHSSNIWTQHLRDILEPHIRVVHDPSQSEQFIRHLSETAQTLQMDDEGAIIIDSLTEVGSLMRDVNAYNLIKSLRADYCKGRDIPIFAGATYTGSPDEFPFEMEYLFDGIIDIAFNPQYIQGLLLKEFTIRKMRGVMAIRESKPFEYLDQNGMMLVKPPETTEDESDASTSNSHQLPGNHSDIPTSMPTDAHGFTVETEDRDT